MKSIIQFTLLSTLFFLIAACSKENELLKTTTVGEIFELKIGAQATINDLNWVVNFLDITEDSRCPTNQTCFWEGQAVAKFNLQINGANQELELTARLGSPQEAEKKVGDRTIRLISVNPYPDSSTLIEKANYTISLVVE